MGRKVTLTRKTADIRFEPKAAFWIKQVHIDRGEPRCNSACAGALALEEAFKAVRVRFDGSEVAFTVGDRRYYYKASRALGMFCAIYDGENGKEIAVPTRIQLSHGYSVKAQRTGGKDNRTDKYRHAPGGRASRPGFKGTKTVLSRNRIAGKSVYVVREISEKTTPVGK